MRAPGDVAIERAVKVALCCAGVMTVGFWAYAVGSPSSYQYSEGDTATWIWLLRRGQDVYAGSSGLTMLRTNYPPLYLWLVAALAPSDAAILLVGRLLAVAGMALTVLATWLSVHAATRSRVAPTFGAVVVLLWTRAYLWGAVCRPDALALGISAIGVTLAVLRVRAWPLVCALLFGLSLMIKQNLIVFPLGVVGWTLVGPGCGIHGQDVRRRDGIALAASLAVVVGVPFFGLHLFVPLVRYSVSPWTLRTFAENLMSALLPGIGAPIVSAVLVSRWSSLPDSAKGALGPWAAVFALGMVWTLSLGRTGSAFNYVLELQVAMTVLATSAFALGLGRILYALQVVVSLVDSAVRVGVLVFVTLPDARADVALAKSALAGVETPVFSEQCYYPIAAGRPPVIIPFLATQLALNGLWDATPFVTALREGAMTRVLLDFPLTLDLDDHDNKGHADRLPPGTLEALRARYELREHTESLYVYAPTSNAVSPDSRSAPSVDR
jgi:hypothetical protein